MFGPSFCLVPSLALSTRTQRYRRDDPAKALASRMSHWENGSQPVLSPTHPLHSLSRPNNTPLHPPARPTGAGEGGQCVQEGGEFPQFNGVWATGPLLGPISTVV